MAKLEQKPQSFKTQREAYWYRKGIEDSQESVQQTLRINAERYNLEWLNHLPTGNE